ncbi:MAG: NADP-specific glutamate dehydrogenase [Lachnospiraceae bacterium]|nr:NADP-specific glutamate dehydrogenase [Lachnospiraceae bacterium]
MMSYVDRVLEATKAKNANEPEFLQTVEEVLNSLRPIVDNDPKYEEHAILERLVEPEKVHMFRVPWVDDNGKVQVNRGFRVQFNSAIGPYKGGLRFQPNVNLSIIKFLGFEQTFKNSLTTLPIGGGKGGSDFDPKGKSDMEVMRFCQSFMNELYRYIGIDVDCPAGDMGVGGREIGYLYGQFKRLTGRYEAGALSGKGLAYGGSIGRPEATGYGAVYYADEYFKSIGGSLKGKKVSVTGFGNVAWGACKKLTEYGAIPVTISGPDGYVLDEEGITTPEKIAFLLEMRASNRNEAKMYLEKFPNAKFVAGERPFGKVKADIYMPCAMQNEIRIEEAKLIVSEGTAKDVIEVSNMPTTNEAMAYLQDNGITMQASKAVNAGGVACSSLEMTQNAEHLPWTLEEVDEKLQRIMRGIFRACDEAAKEYKVTTKNGKPNYVAGANLAGFKKVAAAMMEQGIV